MRSFGDLLQYHQKKKQPEPVGESSIDESKADSAANGDASTRQGDKETGRQGEA
jgi:hypothetical protein